MYKFLRNRNILLCGIVPSFEVDFDYNKYKEARGLYIEDPWERVKSIFSTDEVGSWHPELISAINMAQYGAITGVLYGVATESFIEAQNFFRTSDANIYMNKNEAYKDFNNRTLRAASLGSLRWAPTYALFFGSYSLIASCSELYRNKVDVLDNIIAGVTVGALSRFMFGFKGMISGGVLGGILGTLYGSAMWAVSKLTKTDVLEIKYAQFALSHYNKKRKLNKELANEEDKKVTESEMNVSQNSDSTNKPQEKSEEKHVSKKQDK